MATDLRRVETLTSRVHRLDRGISRLQRELLGALTELEEEQAWVEDGAHDMAHWTTMHLGISRWKAERWLSSGRALRTLPAIADALERGVLGIDKVVELTRFAEFDDEDALVRWAQGVSSGAIRRIGDLRAREAIREETIAAERDRWLEYRYADGGRRFRLDAELPGAAGAVVARALDRLGEQIPVMPDEGSERLVGARRADALVALCSVQLADAADQDRATIVVHAELDALLDGDANALIEDGPVIGGTTLHRLLCNARMQAVVEHPDGTVRADRPALARAGSMDDAPATPPRRYLPVPRMRRAALHAGAPRRMVVSRWEHRPRQPRPGMRVPSPARPRARLGSDTRRRRRAHVGPTSRRGVTGRAGRGLTSAPGLLGGPTRRRRVGR